MNRMLGDMMRDSPSAFVLLIIGVACILAAILYA